MYIQYTLGAIFIVFILCVHCDNAGNYNEFKEIYVPSAPQNLTAKSVTTDEIYLSWAPPTTFTTHVRSVAVTAEGRGPSSSRPEPDLSVIGKKHPEPQADDPMDRDRSPVVEPPQSQGRSDDMDYTSYKLYKNEKEKSDEFSSSSILNEEPYRSKRDARSHRHRKRRQETNGTDPKIHAERVDVDMYHDVEGSIDVVKKSAAKPIARDVMQIAYVLYYEQGVPYEMTPFMGVQTQFDVKGRSLFRSELGIEGYQNATKNLTLLNTSGIPTKVVGFRLRNIKPFTPYKIWVRAFYNVHSLESVRPSVLLEHLGPESDPVYVITDVTPPSAPIILNLTCDQPHGILYLQWRQPLRYNNSLDQYVVTLRRLPEQQPRTRLTLPTTKDDIETAISVPAELWNVTRYEVKIYAVTKSIARHAVLVNGSESPPEEVSSEWCSAHSEARSPAAEDKASRAATASVALMAALLLTLLAAAAAAMVYWRSRLSKCISAAYNFLEEGGDRNGGVPRNGYKKPVSQCSPLRAGGGGAGAGAGEARARPPRMAGAHMPVHTARGFAAHVAALHADGDIGFSKEYEIVVAKSAALGHTSHHSYRPENRLKNRYLNITAYDHSRVCVSSGARCGASGCVGAGRGAACDYVNANYIDGMLPALDRAARRRIERRLERRARPHRQPSVKAIKPPPNLAEGIESAFLNIEFSGIVESDERPDGSDSDRSDDDSDLDDVYVDINGVPRQIKLEWVVWRRHYIATQGPTPATLDAFWRMIWQHRVHTLVMITNLVERGRRKCDMYWPAGGRGSSCEFGGVRVTLLYEDVRAAYTVRHMRVRGAPLAGGEPGAGEAGGGGGGDADPAGGRRVVQYHYTVWPDHGTPRHALAVLPFVKAAADSSTVLVHCSAGVGRTGTYIVLDAQLNQLKLTGTLSPLGFLCRARTQRNHLVQTEEQYVFVHDALLEHVRSGDTEVHFATARDYLVKLLLPISEEELAVMDLGQQASKCNGGIEDAASASEKEIVENGSEASVRTDEVDSELSKCSGEVAEGEGEVEGESESAAVEGAPEGDESEGVYDLAPRSTDSYSKKMQAYNSMNEQQKEEMRRANRAENYALLERMRSLSNRHQAYQGPPPVNLLEKQFQLITRSCVEPSVCARAPHNADKNRPGGILPSDSARVMLVPKPGVEGSEYVNASWVCGRRRVREYAVAQHPPSAAELWRLLWDHTAQLVLLLADSPADPEADVFWPTEEEKELFVANFRASFVSKDTYVAYRRLEKRPSSDATPEPETNGYGRQGSSDCADDERLIPENGSPITDSESSYKFDRTELRLERLSGRDLSARKSIANGDLFSSLSEKRNGPKSPRSPSKMSLKNFKLSSPTKFKFPEWGARGAGAPPDVAPPPPPIAPALTVQEETELRRPCYAFEKVDRPPDGMPADRVIEVTNVSVHSLQDDYQLSVKFIKCAGWLDGDTAAYCPGRPDNNEYVRAVRQASCEGERERAIDRLVEPYRDSFALIEFVAGCQMEYKNGPVVVIDKYGGWRALSFCTLAAACGGARNPDVSEPGAECAARCAAADLYCSSALAAHARCPAGHTPPGAEVAPPPHSPAALLACYCALAAYGPQLHARCNS